jgi:hypothetical protein
MEQPLKLRNQTFFQQNQRRHRCHEGKVGPAAIGSLLQIKQRTFNHPVKK